MFSLAALFERTAYYGIRGIIVFYLIDSLLLGNSEALSIYGTFTLFAIASSVAGAFIGDLLLGNRKALIIGVLFEAAGIFILCLNTMESLYMGLGLILLGSGLLRSNLTASFAKLYLNKQALSYAGFTIYFTGINIGAFIGALLIGYLGESVSWNMGFVAAALFNLIAIIPLLFVKETKLESAEKKLLTTQVNPQKVIVLVLVALVFVMLFELSHFMITPLAIEIGESIMQTGLYNSPARSYLTSLDTLLTLPLFFIVIVIWSRFHSSEFRKVRIAFLTFFGALIFLYFSSLCIISVSFTFFVIAALLLAISQVYISPLILVVLTKYISPKYLTIAIGLTYILEMPFYGLAAYIGDFFLE